MFAWENCVNKLTERRINMGLIYKITNLTNGMVYIGRSNKTMEEAWTAHRYEGNQTNPTRLIGQAIKQFGFNNFACEVIEVCNAEQLRARHKHWISHYQSQGENGYNKKHSGGNVVHHSEIIEMHTEGMSSKDIANTLKCDERTVVSHIKSEGLSANKGTKNSEKKSNKEAILELWESGENHLDIAETLNLTTNTVRNVLRNHGVTVHDLYDRRGLPLPASCRKYEYAQVDASETAVETPDSSSIIADRHDISKASLYNACTGPRTHVNGKMFRRYDEDGEMIPRLCEPVGHTVPIKCINPDNPELVQEFPSITAAAVALTGVKDICVMQKLRDAASQGRLYYGMYWKTEERKSNRRTIYAFSLTEYEDRHVFKNQTEAAIFLHVHQNAISRHLNYPQKYRSTGGYILSWNANFSREDWEEAIRYARPAHGRCKQSQIKQQQIYITDIAVYNVTYCPTLLDAMTKTQSSVAIIQKCLRGEAKSTHRFFVTNSPITFDDWSLRVASLNDNCKPVYGVNPNTNAVITANSIGEAAQKVSCSRTVISKALRQESQFAAGYQWHYGVPQTV